MPRVGRLPPPSMRAIEDWGCPSGGSSVWVSLVRVRKVEASSAGCPAKVAAG
jgi:hypothetical protein